MTEEQTEHLSHIHSFEAWRNPDPTGPTEFVLDFFLDGSEFPGWTPLRIQPVQLPDSPPFLQSLWRHDDDEGERVLRIDVFERSSASDARAFLLELLGEIESPLIERTEELELGDVAFADPSESTVLFTRGNLAVHIVSVGATHSSVVEPAVQFDHRLASEPEDTVVESDPAVVPMLSVEGEITTSGRASLRYPPRSPDDDPVVSKFFCTSGEIRREEGELIYEPGAPGPHRVRVVTIRAGGDVRSETIEFPEPHT